MVKNIFAFVFALGIFLVPAFVSAAPNYSGSVTTWFGTFSVGANGCGAYVLNGNKYGCLMGSFPNWDGFSDSYFTVQSYVPNYPSGDDTPVVPPSESLMSASTFADFVALVVRLLPVIIGLVVSILSVTYILKMLSRFLNSPDPVSDFAQRTIRENDSIMADLKRKERERSGF